MNKVILMGRLTKDVEVRYTQNNTMVATFTLAVNKFMRKKDEQSADFINIVAWRVVAEFCSKYFKKGQQVAVVGKLQTRNWKDDNGQVHYITEVVADECYFADSKKEDTPSFDNLPNFNFTPSADDDLPF